MRHPIGEPRRAAAAVEMAICLPLLMFLLFITIDWARIFYYSVTITNCARQGALYLSDPSAQAKSPYANYTQAALADASNLSPQPNVEPPTYSGTSPNQTVAVKVSWQFSTITNYITNATGDPNTVTIYRIVTMRVAP
jgi:Flp pilus assembly protein TadG